ncbi:MAG: amidohydrolase family protein [Flavobacteriaceae bacterium]|jgi:L-fuconolactonase|nr:amidohydrolase family protein [Flavobacteriaceae bacterium]MDG2314200.1 amidohydrolase family protein [Flavobacteriaceae bacterium]
MIIDSHQHFWKYNPDRDVWIDDTMEVIRKDFLPKNLKPILEQNGIDGCIAVQADQSESETEFLLACAAKNPFIKGVVGWVDLTAKNLEKRLIHYKENPLFKGVRHIVQAEKDNYLLRKDVQKGIGKLAKHNLTYDILVYPHQLPATIQMVEKFPEQKFILDHIAKPNVSAPMNNQWKTSITSLSSFKNVSCKLSGMVTEAKDFEFKNQDFTPFIEHILNCFGPERVMFGSDWPVCLLAADYKKVLALINDYLKPHDEGTKAKILGNNAIKIYNL